MRLSKILILPFLIAIPLASFAQRPGGNLEKAKKIFEELLVKTPNDPDVYKYLGDIYQASNDTAKAREFYAEYAKRMPSDYYAHYRLGEMARAKGDSAEAKKEFEEALRLMDSSLKDPAAKGARARMLALTGDIDESDELFGELLKENPDNIDVANVHIETLIDTKRAKEAEREAERFASKYPESVSIKRNLARAKIDLKKYDDAEIILKELMAQRPDDASLKTDYAYLHYDSGDWSTAGPLFDELALIYPESEDIRATQDDIFKLSRPYIIGGFDLRWIGDEKSYGPYVKYVHPIDSKWKFEADYSIDRNLATITGFDSNFSTFTNTVNLLARYKPHRSLELSLGPSNQFNGSSYVPGAIGGATFDDPVYGRADLGLYYNKLFDDPTSALYFDGKEHIVGVTYENTFWDRMILTALYSSIWYRVDGAKTGTGGGDDFGRQDQGGGILQFIVLHKPRIRVGYGFIYTKLHIVNDYTPMIPLIPESEFHSARVAITHEWNKWITTDVGGFVGADPKRDISMFDLYGFNIANRVKVSKRLELSGGYEYSSESIVNNVGRYQYFFVDFLYRF